MLRQKLARLASDFASQVIDALRASSLEELTQLADNGASRAEPVVKSVKKRAPKEKKAAPRDDAFDQQLTMAALAFYDERGNRGATAQQLDAYLTELGLAPTADVVRVLADRGAIRDSGFRRAAGKNATAPVFIRA